jgi:hypothetical protein
VRRVLAVGLVALVTVGLLGDVAAAAPPAPASRRVGRVLMISLPSVTWADLEAADAPNLDRLFADSAVADLLTRAGGKRFSLGNGYVTIGAGTRAVAPDRVAGEGYDASEPIEGGTAAEVFARRTGLRVDDGLVQLGIHEIVQANDEALFDAEVGALADALDENGAGRAVIGNADGVEAGTVDAGVPETLRAAVAGLMGSDGTVPGGTVDDSLLRPAPRAPFGVLLSPAAVERAFDTAWDAEPGVVLVEGSDLLRADEYRAFTDVGTARRQRNRAIAHTDEIVGRLLDHVDPTRDAVVVVSPLTARASGGLAVAAVRAPGVEAGLLKSGTTRRDGFVDIVDFAPTVLSLLGIDRPESMEGRVMSVSGGSLGESSRIDDLIQASRDSVFRDKHQGAVALVLVLLCALLAVGAAVALSRFRRALVAVELAALGVVGFLLATFLAGPLHFVDRGAGAYWAFLFVTAIVFAGLCTLAGRRSFCDALIVALGITVVVHTVDLVTGARLELNTVFGYSPTVGIRVAGEGNLTFSILSASTLLFAGLVAWRIRGTVGRAVAIATLAVVILVMMAPTFGQDFGASAAAPGFVLLGWLLLGRRIRWRTVVALAGVLVLSALAIGFLDLLRPSDERTHVGRLFEQVGSDGLGGLFLVVRRKIGMNLASFGTTIFVWMIPVAIGFAVVYLLLAKPGTVAGLVRRITTFKATMLAVCVTAALGYLMNDSGVAIPAMMAVVVECSVIFLVVREQRRVPDPSPAGEEARRELGLRGRLARGRRREPVG